MSKKDGISILIVSDLHVGSKVAVAPDYIEHRNNPQQRELLRKWKEMCKHHYNYMIINGDVVDGTQPANQGQDCWTTDLDEQIEAAEKLVKMVDYDKLLVTYGTPYHTKENLNADKAFAKQIGAVDHGWELSFKPEGQKDIFHLSHTVSASSSSWQYRTTPIAKELVASLLNEDALFKYRGIIRSHAHYYCKVNFSHQFGLITPCWQGRTPYMIRKGLSLVPKLGWIVLESDNTLKGWNIYEHMFDMPRLRLTEV